MHKSWIDVKYEGNVELQQFIHLSHFVTSSDEKLSNIIGGEIVYLLRENKIRSGTEWKKEIIAWLIQIPNQESTGSIITIFPSLWVKKEEVKVLAKSRIILTRILNYVFGLFIFLMENTSTKVWDQMIKFNQLTLWNIMNGCEDLSIARLRAAVAALTNEQQDDTVFFLMPETEELAGLPDSQGKQL